MQWSGADGFGNARDGEAWVKVPQVGGVLVGDDVEIGANTTMDRGALGDTVIEDGVRLDNQIQVAHNVSIGAHTAIAACTGIAGSTRIGRRCMIGGGTGIGGQLSIGDDIIITGFGMVTQSIDKPGLVLKRDPGGGGAPVAPYRWSDQAAGSVGRAHKEAGNSGRHRRCRAGQ